MSHRTSIRDALVEKMISEMDGNQIPLNPRVHEAEDGTYFMLRPGFDLPNARIVVDNPSLIDNPYHTNIDNQVTGRNLYPQDIEYFPTVTIALGPETVEYQPAGFRWNFLTLFFRAYVHSEDETEERTEELIQDIKNFIDRNETISYNEIKPDGSTQVYEATQMSIQEITTDEGVLRPIGIGEIRVRIRYEDYNLQIPR